MNFNPCVSVVIPAYNTADYISECLESVIKQTWKNLEIIVINDGSTDNTEDIIRRFAMVDQRIHYILFDHEGVSAARNSGIIAASGEFIIFLDSDDTLELYAIERLVMLMKETHVDIISFPYLRIPDFDSEEVLEQYDFISGIYSFKNIYERQQFIFHEFLNYKIGYECYDKFYRSSFLKSHNIFFDSNISIGEDIAFNLMCLIYTKSIYCHDERLYNYRQRKSSVMRVKLSNTTLVINYLNIIQWFGRETDLYRIEDRTFYKAMIFTKLFENVIRKMGRQQLAFELSRCGARMVKIYFREQIFGALTIRRMIKMYGNINTKNFVKNILKVNLQYLKLRLH